MPENPKFPENPEFMVGADAFCEVAEIAMQCDVPANRAQVRAQAACDQAMAEYRARATSLSPEHLRVWLQGYQACEVDSWEIRITMGDLAVQRLRERGSGDVA
jgi:hypothetical protein